MKLRNFIMLAVLVLVLFASTIQADVLSGCGTCQGSSYLLQYNSGNTTTSGGVSTYDVFLSINPTNYNGGGLYINAVAIKVSSMEKSTGNSVVAAPGGAASWALQTGGLNSGGCDGSGGGFICAQDGHTAPVPPNPAYGSGTTYTWEFHYATTKSLLTGNLASTIKAQYVDASGNKVGALVSEGITLQACTTDCGVFPGGGPVPEPTSVVLFGSLVAFTGFTTRKLRRKA
jgi:hypothetical protein